jgi:hypothetical protein
MGPYRVIRRTQGGSYVLEEMDSSELTEHVAAYRLIPYVKRRDLDHWAAVVGTDNEVEHEISQEPQEQSDEGTQDSQSGNDSESSSP